MRAGEIRTLQDVIGDLRRAKKFVAGGAIIGVVLGFLFLVAAMPCYEAQLMIQPASPMAGEAAIAPAAGDEAAGSGNAAVQAPSPDVADFTVFENIFAGPAVAETLLKDQKILKGLEYDASWAPNWTPALLADYIRKRVREEPVGLTGLRRLTYYHPSPDFAIYFLQQIHAAADGRIRAGAKDEAQKRIAYLQDALDKEENPDHRRAIADLLSEQERLLMLASIDQPYAAAIVEPAAASAKPKWPDRILTLLSFMFAGSLLGFALHEYAQSK